MPSTAGDNIDLEQLLVKLPNGAPLVSADSFSISGNERTLVTGPSGAGKSTLFRAIAGVWPFGSGSIAIPAKATLVMLPQRPYFPIGSLMAAIVYPAETSASSPDRVRDALIAVGLGLRPAPANRPCSAPSPASGRSVAARLRSLQRQPW
jgi:vitamin B12/bleomycin/antimicrobial peptide transport system ATP-binding/permease protein